MCKLLTIADSALFDSCPLLGLAVPAREEELQETKL